MLIELIELEGCMKNLNVVGAIIYNQGKILCTKKGNSSNPFTAFKYEFPGGKVEEGESKEQALSRELLEEMNFAIDPDAFKFYMTVHHEYESLFSIDLSLFKVEVENPIFELKEHIEYKWLYPKDLLSVEWAPADKDVLNQLIKE